MKFKKIMNYGYTYVDVNKKQFIFMVFVVFLGFILSTVGIAAQDPPPGPPGGNP